MKIDYDFAYRWLKIWHEFFWPISKRSNRNRFITINSRLKIALPTIVDVIILKTIDILCDSTRNPWYKYFNKRQLTQRK